MNGINNFCSFYVLLVIIFIQQPNLINEMLLELGDPHTKLKKTFQNYFFSPLRIYYLDNSFYIVDNLMKDSKIKKGMKLVRINEIPIEQYVEKEQKRLRYKSISAVIIEILENLSFSNKKKCFKITCIDDGKEITEIVDFIEMSEMRKFYDFKTNEFLLTSKVSKKIDNTLYYKVFSFMSKNITKIFLETIFGITNCQNLIVDVRDNIGGIVEEAKNFAALFLENSKIIGYEREGKEKKVTPIIINPSKYNIVNKFKNIIFLCNNFTGSSAEYILLNAVKETCEKITIIGTETAGMPHSANIFTLDTTHKLQITTKEYMDINGNTMAEKGIKPDIIVVNDVKYITEGKDKQLEAALQICKST
ncbi:hypothetical protein ELD05_00665 [Caldicellulosiruptor changbaiensis]|uniref:Tail specific protease domain-containing protein n=1 Tax=Caldicellulosiruptor changbaiensis TaxID=1222016 RepID=A0A3T0D2A9_9FIRM|nr:S41 family peptidase [Caldicellulosiruptor changbaiensis]AZT89315.1 hypothetical protein ELD05_00665 [Caldicellulosiruptor changbaiensis]